MERKNYFRIYSCSESVRWVRDKQHIIIVDELSGKSHILQGVDAVIWEWIELSYPYKKMKQFLSVILESSGEKAEDVILDTIQRLEKSGLLTAEGKAAHG